eukprot:m.25437 g.25437  ORF g.25437 m.25437 type:complete len:51 (-) comp6194_c0_seq1:22-174(-)
MSSKPKDPVGLSGGPSYWWLIESALNQCGSINFTQSRTRFIVMSKQHLFH